MQTTRIQDICARLWRMPFGAAGAGAGYWFRRRRQLVASMAPLAAIAPAARTPLYYQDPDGKADYSPTPKKTADGRGFKPVYADAESAAPLTSTAPVKKKIIYYRNPMGLPDTSPVPKKDSMGMDYIPVHEGEDESGVVTVSPARLQMLGVRTVPVEMRSMPGRSIRATGNVQPAENSLAIVNTKFDGFVEKLFVSTTGTQVRIGQPLAQVWIQTPDVTTRMGPDIVTREVDYIVALQQHDDEAMARALQNLRNYGIPDSAIAEIRRTGNATRSITVSAPLSGTVIEKPAIGGMRFNTGDPLFKIADLSKVWVMADVAEQDLGRNPPRPTGTCEFCRLSGAILRRHGGFHLPQSDGQHPYRQGADRASQQGRSVARIHVRNRRYRGRRNRRPAVLSVPDSAIIDSGNAQVVLIAKGQGQFEPRPVHIGARGDGRVQILSGLKPGEQVVVGANFLIDAESNLRAALADFRR